MGRRILLVAHQYPPATGAGTHRPSTMVKYLRRMGHEVTVLSTSAYGRLPDDREQQIFRARDLQQLRAPFRKGGTVEILESGTYENRPHPLSYVLVPEALVLAWAPFALGAALRLHSRRNFDCVLTTSPPESAHLVGFALHRRGVPWVADLRDVWVFESLRPPFPTEAQRRLDVWMERTLLRAADVVTCVSEPLLTDLIERVGANAVLVSNGWDPEAAPVEGESPDLDPGRRAIVYTGRLAHVDRDPSVVVEALAELARTQPELAARLELVFAGSFTPEEHRLFSTSVDPARITVLDNLPRSETLALQRRAAALLLITSGLRTYEVPGKLYEYFGARRPVVALADASAAAVIEETSAGVVIPHGDREGMLSALQQVANAELEQPAPDATAPYEYPALAERMEQQIEAAIGSHE